MGFRGTALSAWVPKCLWHSPLVVTPCAKIASALYAQTLFRRVYYIATSARFAALSWTGRRPAFSCHDFEFMTVRIFSAEQEAMRTMLRELRLFLQPSAANQDKLLILR